MMTVSLRILMKNIGFKKLVYFLLTHKRDEDGDNTFFIEKEKSQRE